MSPDERQRLVLRAVAAIPPGSVASYGDVARLAGLPRGARLVGRILRCAPEAGALPWHRVVNARGRISLPAGDPTRAEQASRLRAEGVPVDDAGVTPPDRRWRPRLELDEWLWGPDTAGGSERL